MWHSDYQFYAALDTLGGGRVGDVRLNVDWIPALRWAEFEQGVNRGRLLPASPLPPVIEPVWSETSEAPYLSGVRIRTAIEAEESVDFPLSYFSEAVTSASAELITSGALAHGQKFEYKVFALADPDAQSSTESSYNVVAVDEPPEICCDELSPLLDAANRGYPPSDVQQPGADEPMPVFIPEVLLEEVTELAREAGHTETGGILVGKLSRDPDGRLFSRVTAQIRAAHTEATQSSLRFTPETWVSVNAALGLRGQGEISLGWWHSHPHFCRNCSAAQRALCPFSKPAFSAADKDLHREVFQKSWNVALLLSFLGDSQPGYDVFAWNRGQIAATNFYSLPGSGEI